MTFRPDTKKSLGQNWLVNQGVAERIVQAAELMPDDIVLEVGPGAGVLTERIVPQVTSLIAIEKDHRLIDPLRERFADDEQVRIEEGDILKADVTSLGLAPHRYKVIANLPYYITSHFLRTMLTEWPVPSLAVLMVQKEVALRMLAGPGSMNLLALSVQLYASVEKLMDVSPGSFRPAPDVDSAVIRLRPLILTTEERARQARTLVLAKRAFMHKRKQLGSTVDAPLLQRCGIDPSRRPQELSLDEFLCLAGNTGEQ
jgi:16S rRNA (adenine1518-N6/adenine1519-N6)-dimethyltransferase